MVTVEETNWLIDTGSPASFGSRALKLDGKTSNLLAGLMGISVGFLAENTGIPLAALMNSAGAEGIIGNELLLDRRICYCPGTGKLIIE